MSRLTTTGFDGDDRRWQNARFFKRIEARFAALLRGHGGATEGPSI